MKRVFLLTLAVITSLASTLLPTGGQVAKASSIFSDVTSYEVNLLAEKQIIRGYEDQTFRPKNPVTRAEAVAMIGRAIGLDDTQRETIFPDVPPTHYASGSIQSGVENSLIGGYEDGTFLPRNLVTRGEMAVFIDRAFQLDKSRTVTFTDLRPQMFSYDSIIKLAESGVTVGYSDGTFRPEQSITRLEFAIFLARAIYPELRPAPTKALAYGTVIDSPEGLSLKLRPSLDEPDLSEKLPEGTTVNIYSLDNEWAYVAALGLRGYVPIAQIKISELSASNIPLYGRTIVVDPGHGGKDGGASYNGIIEKEIVLEVGLLLRDKLQGAGANVVMTRSTDIFLELSERVAIAHKVKADAFISIHANAFPDTSVKGTETFWYDQYSGAESKLLAETIQKHLITKLKTIDRKAKKGNFHVIRESQMPSVLVELGFISNKAEADYMKTAAFKEASAEAILLGVIEFYSK